MSICSSNTAESFLSENNFVKLQSSRLVPIQSIGRRESKCDFKNDFVLRMVENIMGKGEPAFSPFPIMFSTKRKTNFNFRVRFVLWMKN